MMMESIEAMVRHYLTKHNYGGLCNPDAECGCDLADLMACSEPNEGGCVAAYRFDCGRCEDGPDHNNDCPYNVGDADYMMATEADFCHPVYVGEAR